MQMDYLTYCTRLLGQLSSTELKKFIKMPPSGFKEEKKVLDESGLASVVHESIIAAWACDVLDVMTDERCQSDHSSLV
jgi:hypothetical protein